MIKLYSFACSQLNGFKYSKWLNSSIRLKDDTTVNSICERSHIFRNVEYHFFFPLLSCPIWSEEGKPVCAPSMGQIEIFNHFQYLKQSSCVQTTDCWIELLVLHSNTWNHLTFCWSSQLGLMNTLTASLQRGKNPPMSVLDMTIKNLMVRL